MRFKLLALVMLLAIFAPAIVYAEDFTPQTSEDRLTQALQIQGLSLSDNDKLFTSQKCQIAQQKLANLQDKTDKAVRQRIDNYTVIQKELLALKLRMFRQAVDASEIDLLIGKIQQGIDNLLLASNAYGTTVNDLQSINCADKPELFRAGVLLMRGQRLKLLTSAQSLYITVKNADTLAFNQLKKRLTL